MKGSARRAVSTAAEDFIFDVDSSLLSELGEKLVTTVQAALAELVKNAYDADAQTVRVQILSAESNAALAPRRRLLVAQLRVDQSLSRVCNLPKEPSQRVPSGRPACTNNMATNL